MTPYLDIRGLAKGFPARAGASHRVVEGFDLTLAQGEFVTLIGHSGCGKSTVLSMVAGLTVPTAGSMQVAGRPITGPGPDRGVVFQAPCLLHWLSALDNVLLGVDEVHPHQPGAWREALARRYLALVGLEDAVHKRPAELSSGMRQRVGLARAFALTPEVLLLDEPFGMLDSLTRLELQDVLLELWGQQKRTALMVTHDVDEALYLSDRVVMMTSGPAARVGAVLEVPFARPRVRARLLEDPAYPVLREALLTFLEEQSAHRSSAGAGTPPALLQSALA